MGQAEKMTPDQGEVSDESCFTAMGQAHQDATSIQALVRFVQEFLFKVSVTHTTLLLFIYYILSTLPHSLIESLFH